MNNRGNGIIVALVLFVLLMFAFLLGFIMNSEQPLAVRTYHSNNKPKTRTTTVRSDSVVRNDSINEE